MLTGFFLVNFVTFLLNSKTSSLKFRPATDDNENSNFPSSTHIADKLLCFDSLPMLSSSQKLIISSPLNALHSGKQSA